MEKENKESNIEEYLKGFGFDQDGIDNILLYANNEIDKEQPEL